MSFSPGGYRTSAYSSSTYSSSFRSSASSSLAPALRTPEKEKRTGEFSGSGAKTLADSASNNVDKSDAEASDSSDKSMDISSSGEETVDVVKSDEEERDGAVSPRSVSTDGSYPHSHSSSFEPDDSGVNIQLELVGKIGRYVDSGEVQQSVEAMESVEDLRSELVQAQINSLLAETVMETMSDAVLVYHIDLGIMQVNEQFEKMFRMTGSWLRGQNIEVIMPRSMRKGHGNYIKSFMKRWQKTGELPPSQLVNTDTPLITKAVRLNQHGREEEFKISWFLRPLAFNTSLADGAEPAKVFVMTIQSLEDVSEARRGEVVYRRVFKESVVGQLMADSHGTILAGNDKIAMMFGINIDYCVEKKFNIKMLMPDEIAEMHDRFLRRFRRDKARDRESRVLNRELSLKGKRMGPRGPELFPIKVTVWTLKDDLLCANFLDASKYVTKREAKQNILNATLPRRLAWSDNASLEDPEVLKGAVLLLDQKGYTSWVTKHKENFGLLHSHHKVTYSALDRIAEKYKLDVVDHEGDSVLAFSAGRHACRRALYAAVEMIDWARNTSVSSLSAEQAAAARTRMGSSSSVDEDDDLEDAETASEESEMLGARIGIAYGEVVSGVYGSQRRFWKVGGFPVVLAARLEATAEMNHIQIDKSARDHLSRAERDCFVKLERSDLKGITANLDGTLRAMTDDEMEEQQRAREEGELVVVTREDVEEEMQKQQEAQEEHHRSKGKGVAFSSDAKEEQATLKRITTFQSTEEVFTRLTKVMQAEAERVASEKVLEEEEQKRKQELLQGL